MSLPPIKKPSDIREFIVEKAQIFPKNTVILSPDAGLFKGAFKNPQVQLISENRTIYTENIVLSDHVPLEEIWVSDEMLSELEIEESVKIQVLPLSRTPPDSYWLLRQRMVQKRPFKQNEITMIVNDIAHHRLSQLEKTAFVLSQVFDPFNMDEIEELSKAMAQTGEMIDFGHETCFDKHSTGGVPGNKVSLLIVPIIAAAG
ncbi:MAG: hypothetical protein ACFFFH_21330, partial [Candidatus Thorarchaeota archaeon]